MPFSRRDVLKTGAATVAAAVASPPIIARADETLTVAAFGGEFARNLHADGRAAGRKFSCKVVFYDSPGTHVQNYAEIRASRGNPGFDVAAEMTASQNIFPWREGEGPRDAH